MKIYLASSWRNTRYPAVLAALRAAGHDVYDFRADTGFGWRDVDPLWQAWSPAEFRDALETPLARRGFASDMAALQGAAATVLVIPCGRSAHLELGYAVGAGQKTAILLDQDRYDAWKRDAYERKALYAPDEPELMYKMAGRACLTVEEVLAYLASADPSTAQYLAMPLDGSVPLDVRQVMHRDTLRQLVATADDPEPA